jgi:uncharacterized membrane protein
MTRTEQLIPPNVARRGADRSQRQQFTGPLRQFRESHKTSGQKDSRRGSRQNVSEGERVVSLAAGSIAALMGLGRRDLTGLLIAGVGGALVYRGATGHCSMYQALGVDTAHDGGSARQKSDYGVHIVESFLINKSPEELYSFWRNFENFPTFMSHLESVRKVDDTRSHWVAKAPKIYGGKVEWDAEVTADEPNSRIAWRALPESDVEHRGSVKFQRALGDRGTNVRVELEYSPPAGQLGRWVAKLFGEEPEQQIHDDLRKVRHILEVGEAPTIEGQPRGTCTGRGTRDLA